MYFLLGHLQLTCALIHQDIIAHVLLVKQTSRVMFYIMAPAVFAVTELIVCNLKLFLVSWQIFNQQPVHSRKFVEQLPAICMVLITVIPHQRGDTLNQVDTQHFRYLYFHCVNLLQSASSNNTKHRIFVQQVHGSRVECYLPDYKIILPKNYELLSRYEATRLLCKIIPWGMPSGKYSFTLSYIQLMLLGFSWQT